MNKKLPKAKIHRSKLHNNFLRHRLNENRKTYPKQRNYYVSLLRKIKKNYYSNLTEKNITDNKKFWKMIPPFLSDKFLSTERITLIQKVIKLLTMIIRQPNLNVPECHEYEGISRNISHPILKAIVKYRNHPSIKTIKTVSFSFEILGISKIYDNRIPQIS